MIYTFIATLQFEAEDEDEALEKLNEWLEEDSSSDDLLHCHPNIWEIDPLCEGE